MANNKLLTIDITNDSITIIEASNYAKGGRNIHNAIICETPEGCYEDGFIKNKEVIAATIRDQLMANGIRNKDVIFVLSSTKIVNREVMIPYVKENKIKEVINTNAVEYFPVNIEDYAVTYSVLEEIFGTEKQLRVLVVAAPIMMVKTYYDIAEMIGLNVKAIDYIGNSMYQVIKSQMNNGTQMVVHLGGDASMITILHNDVLLLQRTVPYGINSVVSAVMEERNVDAMTALTMLQNDRLITVDFNDNAPTEAFRYLMNNIGRVIDYFSSKHPDKQIDEVALTGDGALIRGIDGLFKIQLNLKTRVLDSLYNVKFDIKIDSVRCNPVYLMAAIGASYDPMNFVPSQFQNRAKGSGLYKIFAAIFVVSLIGSAAASAFVIIHTNNLTNEKDELNDNINKVSYIEDIIAEHDKAKSKADDIDTLYSQTNTPNEKLIIFIDALEDGMPSEIKISDFSSSAESVTLTCTTKSWDSIAQFVVNLKEMGCIENSFTPNIDQYTDDETGEIKFDFTITCNYTNMDGSSQATIDGTDTQPSTTSETK